MVMHCDSPDAVKTAVRRRVGLGILFLDMVQREIKSGTFKILRVKRINLNARSYLFYLRDRPLSRHARSFLDLLHQWRRKRLA